MFKRHVAVLLLVCTQAGAEVYKWVDSNGVTQYGERPPPKTKAAPVRIRDASPPSGSGAAAPSQGNYSQAEIDFRQRQVRREQERAEAEKAARDRECAIAQSRSRVYSGGRGMRFQEPDAAGNMQERVVNQGDEKRVIEEYEDKVSRACGAEMRLRTR